MTTARFPLACTAALALLAVMPVAVSALPGGATYAGKTADGRTVKLHLSRNAKLVKRMRIHYRVTCDDGSSGKTFTDILDARVHSDRTFTGAGTYKGSDDGSTNRFAVSGKLSKHKAKGTFKLKSTRKRKSGAAVHCKTGLLRWQAARTG